MIYFANDNTAPLVRRMWKTCFEDTDEYLDILFGQKYLNENTLIYFDGEEAAASLQMQFYDITFYGQNVRFGYLIGLCTLPQYRGKGYMAQLIHKAHETLAGRGIPLAILVPAEEWLFGFYQKHDYEQVFDSGSADIPLREILAKYPDRNQAYEVFDSLFRDKDFCVQKTRADFEAIADEYILDGCPPKANLAGMACIINPWTLIELYAAQNKTASIRLGVENDTTYLIKNGWVEAIDGLTADITVDRRQLCRLLFGYKTGEMDEKYRKLFPPHHPAINLMLE